MDGVSTNNLMKHDMFWFFLLAPLCFIAGVAVPYVANNGLHKPVPREIVLASDPQETTHPVQAITYYGADTDPVIGNDGKLYIPDNTVVSDITVQSIKTRDCEFRIPQSWVGNVIIRVIRMDQEASGLYADPVSNSEVIQFYEAKTFKKYQTQEFAYAEGARRMGKITELRVMDTTNDLTGVTADPQEIYFSKIGNQYKAFLYNFMADADVIDEEFQTEYDKLAAIDYQGCIISSFRSNLGYAAPANTYIQARYIQAYDSAAVRDTPRFSQEIPVHGDEPPAEVESVPVYEWAPFTSPYHYEDHGSIAEGGSGFQEGTEEWADDAEAGMIYEDAIEQYDDGTDIYNESLNDEGWDGESGNMPDTDVIDITAGE